MKKLFFACYLLLSFIPMVSQTDSLFVQSVAEMALNIANSQNGGRDFVPGIPNGTMHGIVALLIGGLYAFIRNKFKPGKSIKGDIYVEH